jgi:CheY-like chemotaxis protein
MSGFDILKHLKSHPETWNTPVLALTAAAMPNDVKRGLAAGFFRYIAKPLDVNAFLTAIEDALSDSHRGKETAVKTETHNRRATDV